MPEVATQIAERFQKLSQVALQKRKPRNRPDLELTDDEMLLLEEMEDSEDISETISVQKTETETLIVLEELLEIPKVVTLQEIAAVITAPPGNLDDQAKVISQTETASKISLRKIDVSTIPLKKPLEPKTEPESPIVAEEIQEQIDRLNTLTKKFKDEEEIYEEVQIGPNKIKLTIPRHIMKQATASDREGANKLAGSLAAQIMKNNLQLTSSPLIDPVTVWNEIKDLILSKIKISSTSNSTMAAL
jgi:hypothetical protein